MILYWLIIGVTVRAISLMLDWEGFAAHETDESLFAKVLLLALAIILWPVMLCFIAYSLYPFPINNKKDT